MSLDRRLARVFAERYPADAGRVLEDLGPRRAASALEGLSPELAGGALRSVDPMFAARCLAELDAAAATAVLSTLSAAEVASTVGRLQPPDREPWLTALPAELAGAARRLLRFPEGTAGALMDPGVGVLTEELTAAEARKRLRLQARGVLFYLYVVDRERRLVGVVNLRELMLSPPTRVVSAIMHRPVVTLSVHARDEAILAHPGWREFHTLPVVDGAGVFQGVVRYETLRRLETEVKPGGSPGSLVLLLGEIYLSAASALLDGMVAGVTGVMRRDRGEGNDGA